MSEGWSIFVRFTDHPRWVNIAKAKRITKWMKGGNMIIYNTEIDAPNLAEAKERLFKEVEQAGLPLDGQYKIKTEICPRLVSDSEVFLFKFVFTLSLDVASYKPQFVRDMEELREIFSEGGD